MQEHEVTKVYVARVQGCFPEGVQRVNAPLCWDSKLNFASVTEVGLPHSLLRICPQAASLAHAQGPAGSWQKSKQLI